MAIPNQKLSSVLHSGWETYYKEQGGAKAWGGIPDAYLLSQLRNISLPQNANILDVASGDGRNTTPFLNKNYSVVSTDMSPTALESFRKQCLNEDLQVPVLISGDFMAMDFSECQFDCIVSFNAISHFPSIPDVITKMCGLLSIGGVAIFNAFTPNDVSYGVGEKLNDDKFYYKDTLFTFTTENEIKKILGISALGVDITHSATKSWEEDDHGSYRSGKHTHEACFFTIKRVR